jgi:hypothetical protein
MGLFRTRRAVAETTSTPAMADRRIDRVRFDRLLDASIRLRDLGVDHETIERRASDDGISWNEALEAIDRESFDA